MDKVLVIYDYWQVGRLQRIPWVLMSGSILVYRLLHATIMSKLKSECYLVLARTKVGFRSQGKSVLHVLVFGALGVGIVGVVVMAVEEPGNA